jgi:hypothetical protein
VARETRTYDDIDANLNTAVVVPSQPARTPLWKKTMEVDWIGVMLSHSGLDTLVSVMREAPVPGWRWAPQVADSCINAHHVVQDANRSAQEHNQQRFARMPGGRPLTSDDGLAAGKAAASRAKDPDFLCL